MTRFLLDTNVISEIHKPRPHGGMVAWFDGLRAEQISLSAVTLLELQEGIERTRLHNPGRAYDLELWVDEVENSSTILPMDGRCFRETARLLVGKREELIYDAMIAATAILHGLTVATRNEKDFKLLGVAIFNPFKSN
jgi:toxin FitB